MALFVWFVRLTRQGLVTGYVLSFVLLCCQADAGDWPQILGPKRNGLATDEKLSLNWPTTGLVPKWNMKVGSGVAGFAVQGDAAYLYHRVDNEELIQAIATETGQLLWTQKFPATYQPRIMPENGPLCVPTVHDDHLILLGAAGHLRCLNRKTGTLNWEVDTAAAFGADEGYFGFGSCPLVSDGLVIVNVGGHRQNAGVVAFRLTTGEVAWSNGAWQASYSSPVLARANNQPTALVVTRLETVGLDLKTGAAQFSLTFGMRGPTVNGALPVVLKDHLFLTSSYGIGHLWAKLERDNVQIVHAGTDLISSQYTTPVVINNHLIGVDGRQDGGPVDLVCIDPFKNQEIWRKQELGYATLIATPKHLLIMKTDGELVIAAASEKEYQEMKQVKLTEWTCRALPALSNGKLLIRDEKQAFCFDLNP